MKLKKVLIALDYNPTAQKVAETGFLLVKEGDFAGTILETAKDLHADLIVMGSHSQKWLENILVGSVTEKVLRHTS